MTRITLVSIAVVAILMLICIAATSASARPTCVEVTVPETGRFRDNACLKKEAPKEYIFVNLPGVRNKAGELCAKVTESGSGRYKASTCEGEAESSGGEYIKVRGILPDISLALGGAYPLDLHFSDNGKTPTKLETAAGSLVSGEGFEALLELKALGSSGKFEVAFLNVVEGKNKCSTSGAKEGEVITKGEWHSVPITATVNGIAFLVEELTFTCVKAMYKVKGCMLSEIAKGAEKTQLTEIGSILNGSKGRAANREYKNDEGEAVKCVLEVEPVNTKLFREAAEIVNEGKEVPLTVSSPKGGMFTIERL